MTERLDPWEISAALGLPPATSFADVSGGADAALWRMTRGDETFALRLLGPHQADQARREQAAMAAARAAGLPVPACLAAGIWRERPAMVLAWAPGSPLVSAIRAQPAAAFAFGQALGAAQAAIHRVPVPADLLAADWRAWHPPDPALAACLDQLPSVPPALLHLDLHPLNVLSDGATVTAILDWANARAGPPAADLARTEALLTHAPLPLPAPVAARVRADLIAGWRDVSGHDTTAVEGVPYRAWAGGVMLRELGPRRGSPSLPWITREWLAGVRRWTNDHRGQLGIAPLPEI